MTTEMHFEYYFNVSIAWVNAFVRVMIHGGAILEVFDRDRHERINLIAWLSENLDLIIYYEVRR